VEARSLNAFIFHLIDSQHSKGKILGRHAGFSYTLVCAVNLVCKYWTRLQIPSISTLDIMTLGLMAFNIMGSGAQHNGIQHNRPNWFAQY